MPCSTQSMFILTNCRKNSKTTSNTPRPFQFLHSLSTTGGQLWAPMPWLLSQHGAMALSQHRECCTSWLGGEARWERVGQKCHGFTPVPGDAAMCPDEPHPGGVQKACCYLPLHFNRTTLRVVTGLWPTRFWCCEAI